MIRWIYIQGMFTPEGCKPPIQHIHTIGMQIFNEFNHCALNHFTDWNTPIVLFFFLRTLKYTVEGPVLSRFKLENSLKNWTFNLKL